MSTLASFSSLANQHSLSQEDPSVSVVRLVQQSKARQRDNTVSPLNKDDLDDVIRVFKRQLLQHGWLSCKLMWWWYICTVILWPGCRFVGKITDQKKKKKPQKKNLTSQDNHMAKVKSLFWHYLTDYQHKLMMWIYIVQTDMGQVSHENGVKSMIKISYTQQETQDVARN